MGQRASEAGKDMKRSAISLARYHLTYTRLIIRPGDLQEKACFVTNRVRRYHEALMMVGDYPGATVSSVG